MKNSQSLKSVRSGLYEDVYRAEMECFDIDLSSWKKHPYTKLKSHYYLEIGAILTYFILKTKIKPNTITLIYAGLGLLAVALVMLDNKAALVTALFIWFSKAIPDWIDGHIARITDQTSKLGHYLDIWGAHVNVLCFQIGVTFYVGIVTNQNIYFYLACITAVTTAINFRPFVYQYLNKSIPSLNKSENNSRNDITNHSGYSVFSILKNLLVTLRYNGRSSYTDLVVFLIFTELYFNTVYISWIIVWMWTAVNVIYLIYSLISFIKNADEVFN
jgi:phosphatidylglycerophosphate synthase